MDDIVRQAMLKWPNVPACTGWLGLDARGDWYMRDDRTQAIGSFASGLPGAKGSVLRHEKLLAFIGRNYLAGQDGCWYFQNGPQQVYVELEATPWVWRIDDAFGLTSQTGTQTLYQQCWVDEMGWVYVQTPLGLGLVHSQDVGKAASAIEQSHWTTQDIQRKQLERQFHFVRSPQALQAA